MLCDRFGSTIYDGNAKQEQSNLLNSKPRSAKHVCPVWFGRFDQYVMYMPKKKCGTVRIEHHEASGWVLWADFGGYG
jgi:hypothetical protein